MRGEERVPERLHPSNLALTGQSQNHAGQDLQHGHDNQSVLEPGIDAEDADEEDCDRCPRCDGRMPRVKDIQIHLAM